MSALHPSHQATVHTLPEVVVDAPKRVRAATDGAFPRWFPAVQLGASIAAVAVAWFAVVLLIQGFGLYALPVAVLAIGILVATFAVDPYSARLDRLRAAEDAEVQA